MKAQQSHDHHYVPQWYQRRFLPPDSTKFLSICTPRPLCQMESPPNAQRSSGGDRSGAFMFEVPQDFAGVSSIEIKTWFRGCA
jgi:hypothetical protein